MNFEDIAKKIYFVGIGGVSMSAIAEYLHKLGYDVCGSDKKQSESTLRLQELGIPVYIGENQQVNAQLVVRTSAVPTTHPQIRYATNNNIPVVLREQILGAIFNKYPIRVAVCGTHGKTTATAMLRHILSTCQIEHTAFVGGRVSGDTFGGGEIVVAEACEYNRSFLYLQPTHTLCLNVEYDHPDCYKDLTEVQNAFGKLFEQSQKVILPKTLQNLCKNGIFYDDFCAKILCYDNDKALFDLYYKKDFVCKCQLSMTGYYNVQNALAVLAVAKSLGLPLLQCAHALATFCGVERRWTEKPFVCRLVCDYAHHPTELRCAIDRAKEVTSGKVVCVFQPHTYTRTQAFWHQFASCFEDVCVCYLPVFSAREKPIYNVTSQNLCSYAKSIGINACFAKNFDEAQDFVFATVNAQDLLLILGAGDVVELADLLQTKSLSQT